MRRVLPHSSSSTLQADFSSSAMPRAQGSHRHGAPSFKADFALPATAVDSFELIEIPFGRFSADWSEYTGRCDTRDPSGEQHHCCSATQPEGCVAAKHLETINSLNIWAEGIEGNFQLDIRSISAGPANMVP